MITNIGFQIGSRLCDNHFDVFDFVKGKEIGGTFFLICVVETDGHSSAEVLHWLA